MEKRLIIAVALSLMVLLVFQKMSPKRQVEIPCQEERTSGLSQTVEESRAGDFLPGKKAKNKSLQKEDVTEIETEKYKMLFSDIGGNLKKLSIKGYNGDIPEEVLVEENEPDNQIFSTRSPLLPDLDTQKFKRTEGENFIEYTMEEDGLLSVTKRYVFRKSLDYIGLSLDVKNLSSRDILFSYQITGPSSLKKADIVAGRNFLEANALIDGKIWKTKAGKKTIEKNGSIAWVALKNRYFSLILQSLEPAKSLIVQPEGTEKLVTRLNSGSYRIVPSETITSEYCLYAGPLDDKKIAGLGNEDMSGIVDYGFFGSVSKVLLAILNFFYSMVHNWGVAIICLTILINAILFPLTYKSFSSMQKMKKIQPHMVKLKELHKDNPHKLNKETMELYKKYNVNPLGGCLPMLLQMPIFIALYQGLMRSIELKGAHFLWIKNLARPEAVPLPFSLPVIGASINILPLLMVGMMVIQQKISQGSTTEGTTPEQAKQQKMMMMFMPIIFGFLFYQMPSGLVLYWLTNTVLMTAEQIFIVKRTGE